MARRYQVARRSGFSRWTRRLFGVLATGVLLATGVATAGMVLPEEDEPVVRGPEAALPPLAPGVNGDGPRRLTKQQRKTRRAAVAQVRRLGFNPERLSDYRPDHVLRVLVGANETGRRAFFFVGKRYAGTDAATPSTQVRVTRQLERQITLGYTLYEPDDRACCPRGGEKRVRFRWVKDRLRKRDKMPPPSRRQATVAPSLG